MLKWNQIMENFVSIDVGKDFNGEVHYWTTFYYYNGLVIDTGCPLTAEESVDFLETMKYDVKAILLSHFHEDHSGGAYLFAERFGVRVFAPRKSIEIMGNPPEIPTYRQMVWGQPKPVEAKPLEKEMRLDEITITVIDTPGHSFDHVSFFVENMLFMGDLVANQNPIIVMKQEDYLDLIDSLRAVLDLKFETAYGGHGIWDKEAIRKTLNNILKLKEKVETLSHKGLSPEQIANTIFSEVPKKVLIIEELSQFEWSRKNLVESLLGLMHMD